VAWQHAGDLSLGFHKSLQIPGWVSLFAVSKAKTPFHKLLKHKSLFGESVLRLSGTAIATHAQDPPQLRNTGLKEWALVFGLFDSTASFFQLKPWN